MYQNDPRPHALERILPTGAAQLIVNLKEDQTRLYDPEFPHRCVSTSGSVLSGVQSRFQVIDTSEQEYVAGVAFKPGGTVPSCACLHTKRAMPTFPWSRSGAVVLAILRERLLESRSIDASSMRSKRTAEMWARRAASCRHLCSGRVRSSAIDDQHCGGDGRHRAEREAIHRTVQERSGRDAKRYCRIRRFQRAVTLSNHDRHVDWTAWRWTAATSIRRTSFTTSARSRASRRRSISRRERRFRTTSNFYNPTQTASETMAVWQIQKTHIARYAYLVVLDADAELAFLKAAFGGDRSQCQRNPDNTVMHAEITIGDSLVMLGQAGGPLDTSPCSALLWVDDVDATYARALQAGATSESEPEDKPYGHRNAGVIDRNGITWWIGAPVR